MGSSKHGGSSHRKDLGPNTKAKLGGLLTAQRGHPRGRRENEHLCLDGSKGVGGGPPLSESMSLAQLSEALQVLAKNGFSLGESVPTLCEVWPAIKGGSYPLPLGEFVQQVGKSAPEGSLVQENLKRLSEELGASGKPALDVLLGGKARSDYSMDLEGAESFGGYGADGGKTGPSAAARQGAGAHAALRLAGLAVSTGSAHGCALFKELSKMPSLDADTLTALSEVVPDPPTIGACNSEDISLNSIFFWGSGSIFIFEGSIFKVCSEAAINFLYFYMTCLFERHHLVICVYF